MNTDWIRIIHVARKKTGIDEDAYRGILAGAGAGSSKDIATADQFNLVMDAFKLLGFQYSHHANDSSENKQRATESRNPDYITFRQEYYIRGLQRLAMRAKDEKSLRAIIHRIGKVDDIAFLKKNKASAVILALRDICWKAGINPDHKDARRPSCS